MCQHTCSAWRGFPAPRCCNAKANASATVGTVLNPGGEVLSILRRWTQRLRPIVRISSGEIPIVGYQGLSSRSSNRTNRGPAAERSRRGNPGHCQMRHCSVSGDHQVQARHDCRRVHEGIAAFVQAKQSDAWRARCLLSKEAASSSVSRCGSPGFAAAGNCWFTAPFCNLNNWTPGTVASLAKCCTGIARWR